MKKNMLLFLLMAFGCESVQAMNNARKFARKVFYSKASLSAFLTSVGWYSATLYSAELFGEYLDKSVRQEPDSMYPQVREQFKQHGFSDLMIFEDPLKNQIFQDTQISKYQGMVGVLGHGNKATLIINKELSDLLRGCPVLFTDKTNGQTVSFLIKKDHADVVVKHELAHLMNKHLEKEQALMAGLGALSILVAKAAHVAKVSKVASLGVGSCSALVGALARSWYSRKCELEADSDAATDKESATCLAQYLYSKSSSEHTFIKKLFHSHPSVSVRIRALEERYGKIELSHLSSDDAKLIEQLKLHPFKWVIYRTRENGKE